MLRKLLLLSFPVLALAETRTIIATHYFNSFDHRNEPLAHIRTRAKEPERAAIDLYDFGFDLFSRPLGVSASQSALSGGWARAFIIFSSTSAGGRYQVLITYPALTRSPLARINSTTRPSPSASTRVTTG